MNKCPECGKKLKKNEKVCPNCGKKVKMVKNNSKNVKSAKVSNNTEKIKSTNKTKNVSKNAKTIKSTKKEVEKVIDKVSEVKTPKKKSKNLNALFWILSFILPPVGLVLYLVWKNKKKALAKSVKTGTLVSACIWIFLGLTLLIDANGAEPKEDYSAYEIYNADIDNWVEATESDEPVITVIGLTYCQYCKNYNPVINKVAKEKGIAVYWFDADDYDDESFNTLISKYEISYTGNSPYTLVTKGGEILGEYVAGYMEESETISFLEGLGL